MLSAAMMLAALANFTERKKPREFPHNNFEFDPERTHPVHSKKNIPGEDDGFAAARGRTADVSFVCRRALAPFPFRKDQPGTDRAGDHDSAADRIQLHPQRFRHSLEPSQPL